MGRFKENYSSEDYVVVIPYSDEAFTYLMEEFADTYMATYDDEEIFLMQFSDLRKFFEEYKLEDDGVEVYAAPRGAEYLEDVSDISLEELDKICDGL